MAQNKRILRKRVYFWLERPDRAASGPKILETALICLICLNIAAVMLETVPSLYTAYRFYFIGFEVFSVIIFALEYIGRLFAAPEAEDAPPRGARLRYALTPHAIIDLIAILPSLLSFILPLDLRILRMLRLLRIFKFTRFSSAMSVFKDVMREELGSFLVVFAVLCVLLVFSAAGVWIAENQAQPEAFGSVPAALWWAVVTLTTVGYGDVYPITTIGKIFGGIIAILGIGVAALPAGILAGGFAQQLRQRREDLRREFRRVLESGNISLQEETELELLRKRLGITRHTAESIREEMLETRRQERESDHSFCPVCGFDLDGPEKSTNG